MTTTINASTSSGLVNTADTSGVLQLQTASTAAVTIDASQNVGIGTTSPASYGKFVVFPANGVGASSQINSLTPACSGGGYPAVGYNLKATGTNDTYTALATDSTSLIQFYGDTMKFFTAASVTGGTNYTIAERMRIDSSGNVGIGTSSPTTAISIYRGAGNNAAIEFAGNGNTLGTTSMFVGQGTDTLGYVYQRANSALLFGTNNTERMRIDSSGNLLLGGTGTGGNLTISGKGSEGWAVKMLTPINSGTYNFINFCLSNTSQVGSIQSNGSTTSYNTSSDYRLKENIVPMIGALAKVTQLKPCTYKWKLDGSDGEGFIAHELAEVCPHAVSGEKDAVNADNTIKPQGIDTSFLVATLTAAIQEQQALITNLTTRLAALEGAK